MAADYVSVLATLSEIFDIPLRPDNYNTCLIRLEEEQLELQIEMDQQSDDLILGSNIATLPPGRFRENVLEHALKANNLDRPRGGILAYSNHADKLVLFLKIFMDDKTSTVVAELLPDFLEKATKWKNAIEANQLPALTDTFSSAPSSGGGMFGLTS